MGKGPGRRRFLTRLAALGGVGTLATVSSRPAAAASTTVGELATISVDQLDHDWRTLSFDGAYDDPVVVMGPLSENGSQSAHPRLRSVSTDRAEWRIEEWSYRDGRHVAEELSYLVTESGENDVNGLPVRAGTVETDHRWTSVTFASPFERTPVVLAQSQTFAGNDPIVTRIENVSATGFDVRVQEEEARGGHMVERVGYIAIGAGTADGFETGTLMTDHEWASPSTSGSYGSPAFVASMQTTRGTNTAGLRHRNLDDSATGVRVEEERSDDGETEHLDERIGYLVGHSGRIDGTNRDDGPSDTDEGNTGDTDEPTFGAYFAQHVGEDPTQEYEEWLGRSALVSDQFIHKEGHYRDLPGWKIDPWTNWLEENQNRRLAWNLRFENLPSLRRGANGAANDTIRSFGETLVAKANEDAYLRIEGEFDLTHTVNPETTQECQWFVEYWREVVDTLRSIDGEQFDIVWNPNYSIATDEGYAERTWPGNEYVDMVGIDIYDLSWKHYGPDSQPTRADHERAWEQLEVYLDWFRQWCDDHGKPLCVPEWGLWSRTDSDYAGGDNPYFIQQMHDWVRANDVAWHVYFEDLWKHSLSGPDTHFPESAARFKQLFG